MYKISRISIVIILASLLSFSLVGISYYFPSSNDDQNGFSIINKDKEISEIIGSVGTVVNLPNITIGDKETIEPLDAPIQQVGNLYTLTNDIVNQTLRIQRNDIIIDGTEKKIQGTPNAAIGIALLNVNNVTIKNIELIQFWYGISLMNCSNITINGNVLDNIGSRAITITSSNNTVITNNVITSTATAIEITSPDSQSINTIVAKNTITNAAQGITIEGLLSTITENNLGNIHLPIGIIGNDTIISKNNLVNGIGGIYLTGNHCKIYQNNILNFSESGITINSATNCDIYENNISNSECSIILRNYENTWRVENNSFYHNNLINNTQSVSIELPSHSNVWDTGFEGNYWSNYNGTDSNGDGIGDTPYVIDENNIDYFPLMSQHYTEDERNMLFVYLGIIGLVSFGLIVFAIMLVNKRKK